MNDALLSARLDAIGDAQKRSRIVLIICTFASSAIVAGLFNLYISSDRLWAAPDDPDRWDARPSSWVKEQVQARQIASWVDGHTVGVGLLGIRLSTSDASVVGTLVLLSLAFYHCLCARRENHEIGALLTDVRHDPSDEQRTLIYRRISAFMVAGSSDSNDAPYTALDAPRTSRKILFIRGGLPLLVYLPAMTLALVIASDIYFVSGYVAPYDSEGLNEWSKMSATEHAAFIAMLALAFVGTALTAYYCKTAVAFRAGTEQIVTQYGVRLARYETKDVALT